METRHRKYKKQEPKQLKTSGKDKRTEQYNYVKFVVNILKLLRIVLVFQPGYVQPDEFHQFTEPLAEKFLKVKTLKCWEFTRDQPLRSMVLPQLIAGPWFTLLWYLFYPDYSSLPSYAVLIGPRLIMVLLTFLIDKVLNDLILMIHVDSKSKIIIYNWTCLIHSSSYLALVYYPRTFTNTTETVLFALLVYVIFDSIKNSNQMMIGAKVGILLSIGFFNRPTFVVFAFVPTLFWLLTFETDHYKQKRFQNDFIWTTLLRLIKNSLRILSWFIPISIIIVAADSYFYRSSLTLNNLVITPWNFLEYNLQKSNLANHGIHPVYFHWIVCFPLMFTLLAGIAFWNWLRIVCKQIFQTKRWQMLKQNWNDYFYSEHQYRFQVILHLTILFSLTVLSLIPHHEPRFLLSLIIPVIILFAYRLAEWIQAKKRWLLALWIVVQICLAVFFGFVHQAGIVRSVIYLKQNHYGQLVSNQPMTSELIFSRMYLPPRHLLLIPSESTKTEIKDYSIEPLIPSLAESFHRIINHHNHDRIFLIIPSCYEDLTMKIWKSFQSNHSKRYQIRLIHKDFPNFTGEDLGECLQGPKITDMEYKNLIEKYNVSIPSSEMEDHSWTTKIVNTFSMSIFMIKIQ